MMVEETLPLFYWSETMKKTIVVILSLIILVLPLLGFTIYKYYYVTETKVISDIPVELVDIEEDKSIEIVEKVEEPKTSNINLLAVGDIMYHSPQFRAAYDKEKNIYDFTPSFKHIKKYVENADIAIGNLETVTAGEEYGFHGFPRFNTPKEVLLALKETGFHILSTANNHSLDRGKTGIIRTIEYIEEYGMKNIGTNIEPNNNILVEEVKDIKIAFLSYTYGLNGLDSLLTKEELGYMVNLIDEEKIKNDIDNAKSQEVDLIVVFIHWGHEYHNEPWPTQIELGEKMVNWGANIILGSHPHVVQKSQIIEKDGKDNFIIYSMGNIISNQRNDNMGISKSEDGVMVNLGIEKDFTTGATTINNVKYIPTWVYRYREGNKLHFEILPIEDALENKLDIDLSPNIISRLEKSKKDTMNKMFQN